MADQEVKIRITTDASGAITGFKQLNGEMEKTTAKSENFVSQMKSHWFAYAAAAGAAMVAINKAWSLANAGAGIEETRGILNNLSKQYKTTADDIVAAMEKASKGLIANSDLAQVALGGLAKGLNPEQLINLANAADVLGDSIGVTATQALNDLTQALESGRVKGLKNFAGSTIDLKDTFGDLASKMSAAEKTQAMYALIMIHTTDLQKKQTDAVNDAADKFESMEAKYKNYADTFSVVMMKMTVRLGDYLMAIGKASQKTAQFFGLTDLPSGASRDFGEPEDRMAEYKKQIADLKALLSKRDSSDKGAKEAESATKTVIEATRKATYELETIGQSQYEKDIARITSEAEKYREAGADKIKVAEWVATETALADAKNTEAMFKTWRSASETAVDDMMKDIDAGVKQTQDSLKKISNYDEMMGKEKAFTTDPHQDAINRVLEAEREKFAVMEDMRARNLISEEQYEKDKVLLAQNSAEEIAKINADLYKRQLNDVSAGFGDLSSAFEGISKMYAEGSEDAKRWQEAADAMLIAQKAVAVVQAVVAIATQGSGDPYTAFARIAAMAAAMGALLATIGESVNGSGAAAAASYNPGKSTVLGSEDQSTSLTNSYELLKDTYDMEYERLTALYHEMRQIKNNLGNMAAAIIRTGKQKDYIGIADQSINNLLSGEQSAVTIAPAEFILPWSPYYHNPEAIPGSKVNDPIINNLFTNTFKSISKSLIELAVAFGVDTKKVLDASFGKMEINTQKISGEELTKRLTEQISAATDKLVGTLFGDIVAEYQKIGESLLDTAMRLVTDKEVILSWLEKLNQSFNGTIPEAIRFSEILVDIAGGLEELTDAFQTYYDAFFSDEEKQADLKKQLTAGLGQYGFELPNQREDYRALVESLNLTTEAGQAAYVALMQMSESADKYYEYLEDAKSQIKESDFATRAEYLRAVKGYAAGGSFAGGIRIVGELGPEIEYTGPSYISSTQDSRKALGTDDVIAQVQKLSEEISRANFNAASGMPVYVNVMQMPMSADSYYERLEKERESLRESESATRAEYVRDVRGYAAGGSFAGGIRVVGELGPEIEYTGPSYISSTQDSRKALGTDEMIAEVQKLRAEVGEANFKSAVLEQKLYKLLDKWDGEGIPEERA